MKHSIAVAMSMVAACAKPAQPVSFVENDLAKARGEAIERHVPLFVDVWAPW